MAVIVSTCGTSILTNAAKGEERSRIFGFANDRDEDLSEENRTLLDRLREAAGQQLANASREELPQRSAELNALISYLAARPNSDPAPDTHLLLVTDTAQGRATASLLADQLRRLYPGATAESYPIRGLVTNDEASFRLAMGELVDFCVSILPQYAGERGSSRAARTVFNLTGGFKGVAGLLHSLGTLYADEMIYIFQAPGSPLLRLPRLPIDLNLADWARAPGQLFRRMDVFGSVPARECDDLPETLFDILDDQAELSLWGRAAWAEERKRAYPRELLAPISPYLEFDRRFVQQANEEQDRLEAINRRIDDLCKLLETHEGNMTAACQQSPKSLGLKRLKGVSNASIWEMNAWSNGEAGRIFAHTSNDGGKAVLHIGLLRDHLPEAGGVPGDLQAYIDRTSK